MSPVHLSIASSAPKWQQNVKFVHPGSSPQGRGTAFHVTMNIVSIVPDQPVNVCCVDRLMLWMEQTVFLVRALVLLVRCKTTRTVSRVMMGILFLEQNAFHVLTLSA